MYIGTEEFYRDFSLVYGLYPKDARITTVYLWREANVFDNRGKTSVKESRFFSSPWRTPSAPYRRIHSPASSTLEEVSGAHNEKLATR